MPSSGSFAFLQKPEEPSESANADEGEHEDVSFVKRIEFQVAICSV